MAYALDQGSKECDGSRVRNRSIVEYMKKTCHARALRSVHLKLEKEVDSVATLMEVEACGSNVCHNRRCSGDMS